MRLFVILIGPLLLILTTMSAMAGSVSIIPASAAFSLTVKVKNSPQGTVKPLSADNNGNFIFSFGAATFDSAPYVRRIFVLTWTPNEENNPARGVREFSIELPILLRSWRIEDEYTIRAGSFDGIGNRWLSDYEQMTNPEDQWVRFFASAQMADHYWHRIRPTVPESARALNTAIDGLTRITQQLPVAWLELPFGMQQKIDISLARDDKKRFRLTQALANINSLIWRDVADLPEFLANSSCEFVQAAVRELDNRRRDEPTSFALQFKPDDETYNVIRDDLIRTHCSD